MLAIARRRQHGASPHLAAADRPHARKSHDPSHEDGRSLWTPASGPMRKGRKPTDFRPFRRIWCGRGDFALYPPPIPRNNRKSQVVNGAVDATCGRPVDADRGTLPWPERLFKGLFWRMRTSGISMARSLPHVSELGRSEFQALVHKGDFSPGRQDCAMMIICQLRLDLVSLSATTRSGFQRPARTLRLDLVSLSATTAATSTLIYYELRLDLVSLSATTHLFPIPFPPPLRLDLVSLSATTEVTGSGYLRVLRLDLVSLSATTSHWTQSRRRELRLDLVSLSATTTWTITGSTFELRLDLVSLSATTRRRSSG